MARKTFRTIYLYSELESRLLKHAEHEHSSVSRLVRIALENYLKKNPITETVNEAEEEGTTKAMEA